MGELPIFRDHPFPVLQGISEGEVAQCRIRFDTCLDLGESASNVGEARARLEAAGVPRRAELLEIHRNLFAGRPGSGVLRESEVEAVFAGQDCPPARFLERSLENFDRWLVADSFSEIHPIEQAALTMTRLVDIWPFEFGNRTAATVFSSFFLSRAGYPPFLVLPEEMAEFDQILSAAIRMQTAPLVQTIYRCIERELGRVRS